MSITSTPFHVHLVSDSTGETVSSVFRAAMAQFDELEVEEHVWSLMRTQSQFEKMLQGVQEYPGVILYTLVDKNMRRKVREACQRLNIPSVPVLGPVIRELSSYFGEEAGTKPGTQHELSDDYFDKVDAINFALAHDDGQAHWELDRSDIVVVGPSRTSKSPTCVYLAYRGYKAANVPFVKDCPLPESLFELKNPMVIGLTISIDRLLQIRKSRLQSLEHDTDMNYVDEEYVKEEMDAARKLYREQGWPSIDVTRRSVEESATLIIQHYHKRMEREAAKQNAQAAKSDI